MPFDRGPVTFRILTLPEPLPDDALERFAAHAAGSLEHVTDQPQWGWVSGRHLLEQRIDEETARLGGYLHLTLRQAVRKIPASLLRAECRMAELAYVAENKASVVPRKERLRIKQEVGERLLPRMPPQLSGIAMAVDASARCVYAAAASDRQLDQFLSVFKATIGFEPIPLTPEAAAAQVAGIAPDALPQLNFSPDVSDDQIGGSLGQDFLTWLWFFQEQRGGMLPRSQLGEFGLMVDGPLVFVAEGPGSFESAIRRGAPTASAEAKAALMVGKKLKRAKIALARSRDEVWSVTVDADSFVFRGLRLPEGETVDPAGIFEERMTNLYVFQKVFLALFTRFVEELQDTSSARKLQVAVKKWVQERAGK